jgi:hypothetical protein
MVLWHGTSSNLLDGCDLQLIAAGYDSCYDCDHEFIAWQIDCQDNAEAAVREVHRVLRTGEQH